MLYTILFTFVFSVLLLTRNFKNKYTWIFSFMFLSISFSLFFELVYLIKISGYSTLLKIDTPFILFLSKMRMNFNTLCRLFYFGIAMYMLSLCFFCSHSKNTSHYVLRFVLSLIPLFAFVIFNDPYISYLIYKIIYLNRNINAASAISTAQSTISNLNYIIIAFYLFFPVCHYYKHYKNEGIILYKTSAIVNIICIFLINTLFCVFFVFGPFNNLLFGKIDLLKFNTSFSFWKKTHYIYVLLSTLIIPAIITFLLIKFKTIDTVDFFKKREIVKNAKMLDINLKMMLHSYKNTLFSLKISTQIAKKSYGNKELFIETMNEINDTIDQCIDATGKFVDCFKPLSLSTRHINIINCLDDAISKSNIPPDVIVNNSIEITEYYVFGDYLHITEAFKNIIVNSIQAIQESEKVQGVIEIYTKCNLEWIIIFIRDNGIGITKKNQKKIFNALFSTKNTHTNWGLGLAYVYKVVKAHLGFISVKSTPNEFTEFQIMFPHSTQKKKTADYFQQVRQLLHKLYSPLVVDKKKGV